MKSLERHEADLAGRWTVNENRTEADDTCKRIEWLTAEKLQKVAGDPSGWNVLYLDTADGRYWELTFPQSHMQGGGPPRLTHLPQEEVMLRYGEAVVVESNAR